MATKLLEKKAFKKLCDAFPNMYCTLDLEMRQFSSNTKSKEVYKAYVSVDGVGNHLSDKYKYPIEAVNEVLKHFDREV